MNALCSRISNCSSAFPLSPRARVNVKQTGSNCYKLLQPARTQGLQAWNTAQKVWATARTARIRACEAHDAARRVTGDATTEASADTRQTPWRCWRKAGAALSRHFRLCQHRANGGGA
jgi:hypothetical protein